MDKFRWKGTVITVSADLSRNAYAIRGNIYSIHCMSRYPIRISLVRLIARWNNVSSFQRRRNYAKLRLLLYYVRPLLTSFSNENYFSFFFHYEKDFVWLNISLLISGKISKIRHFIRIKTSTKRKKILRKHRQTLYSDTSQFCWNGYAVIFHDSPLSP